MDENATWSLALHIKMDSISWSMYLCYLAWHLRFEVLLTQDMTLQNLTTLNLL